MTDGKVVDQAGCVDFKIYDLKNEVVLDQAGARCMRSTGKYKHRSERSATICGIYLL